MPNLARAVTLALVLMLLYAGSALAQDAPSYCENLTDDECALIESSQAAMQNVYSGNSEVQLSVLLTEIPEMPIQDFGFAYQQVSSFSMNEDASALVSELQGMSPMERQQMLMEPDALPEMLTELILGTSTAIDMAVAFSDEVAQVLSDESGLPVPTEMAFSLVLLDGILYVNLDALAEIVPELAIFSGWVGFEMEPLLAMAFQDTTALDMSDPNAQAMGNGLAAANFGASGPLVVSLNTVDPTESVTQFLDVERLEDDSIDGNDVAVFRTTFDFASFFASPIFYQLVEMAMQDESISGGAPADAETVEQTVAMAQVFGPMLLSNLNLELLEGVGLDDAYLYGTSFLLEWDLSNIVQLAGMAEGAGVELPPLDPNSQPFIGIESLSLNSGINEPVEIEAPEGAMVIPIEALMTLSEF